MEAHRKARDISLDLETQGIAAGCGLLSIGACTFDTENAFYAQIDPASNKELGLYEDPITMDWWNKQSPEAREAAFCGTTPIITALGMFADWVQFLETKGQVFVWGNGSDFDNVILAHAYRAAGMDIPWGKYNNRCYRTLKNLPSAKDIKPDAMDGVRHHALDDAKFQALHAMKILRALKG